MSDIFGEDHNNEEVTFDVLVGEGKKYRDPDALAKAKIEADRFIEQLKAETEQLRNELRTRTNLDEVVERLTKTPEPREITPMRQEPTPPNTEEPKPDFDAKVRQLLAEEKAKETKEANIQAVRAGLKERFGADYNETLKTIAKELSVSENFLYDLGTTSPSGFFKLIDSSKEPDDKRPLTPPRGVDTPLPSGAAAGRKNKAYYDDLRRKDINLYFSPKIQNEMHREAMQQGAKFYE